jgi:hypothetical protein
MKASRFYPIEDEDEHDDEDDLVAASSLRVLQPPFGREPVGWRLRFSGRWPERLRRAL